MAGKRAHKSWEEIQVAALRTLESLIRRGRPSLTNFFTALGRPGRRIALALAPPLSPFSSDRLPKAACIVRSTKAEMEPVKHEHTDAKLNQVLLNCHLVLLLCHPPRRLARA